MLEPAARKAPMPATVPLRPRAVALGLILPLALAGAASAQQQDAAPRTAWVDPPPRTTGATSPATVAEPAGHPSAAARAEAPAAPAAAPASGRHAAAPEPGAALAPKAARAQAPAPKRMTTQERMAAQERRSGRDTLHRRAHHPHRLAAAPAAFAPAWIASAERAAAARALTADYLATVSGPADTMVGAANRFYATRVHFYGHPITPAGLVAEKRSFVQRWPERRYAPRLISAACDPETCTIRAIVDFRTANPDRGAVSSGEAELILEVGFAGSRPYIIAETGRVLRRSLQAGTLAPSPGKA
jgi:hypothetical protein